MAENGAHDVVISIQELNGYDDDEVQDTTTVAYDRSAYHQSQNYSYGEGDNTSQQHYDSHGQQETQMTQEEYDAFVKKVQE